MITAALSSKRIYDPSARPYSLAVRTITARTSRDLDGGDDDVAHSGVPTRMAAQDSDAHDFLGARVIGHTHARLNLNH